MQKMLLSGLGTQGSSSASSNVSASTSSNVFEYYRSSVKRSKGIIVDQGGELMVEITWRDAPSQIAKSCVGKADNFKVDDFLVDYKVRKIERIAISNNVAVAAISNSTSSSGKK